MQREQQGSTFCIASLPVWLNPIPLFTQVYGELAPGQFGMTGNVFLNLFEVRRCNVATTEAVGQIHKDFVADQKIEGKMKMFFFTPA